MPLHDTALSAAPNYARLRDIINRLQPVSVAAEQAWRAAVKISNDTPTQGHDVDTGEYSHHAANTLWPMTEEINDLATLLNQKPPASEDAIWDTVSQIVGHIPWLKEGKPENLVHGIDHVIAHKIDAAPPFAGSEKVRDAFLQLKNLVLQMEPISRELMPLLEQYKSWADITKALKPGKLQDLKTALERLAPAVSGLEQDDIVQTHDRADRDFFSDIDCDERTFFRVNGKQVAEGDFDADVRKVGYFYTLDERADALYKYRGAITKFLRAHKEDLAKLSALIEPDKVDYPTTRKILAIVEKLSKNTTDSDPAVKEGIAALEEAIASHSHTAQENDLETWAKASIQSSQKQWQEVTARFGAVQSFLTSVQPQSQKY